MMRSDIDEAQGIDTIIEANQNWKRSQSGHSLTATDITAPSYGVHR
jgi:hypothetical protein